MAFGALLTALTRRNTYTHSHCRGGGWGRGVCLHRFKLLPALLRATPPPEAAAAAAEPCSVSPQSGGDSVRTERDRARHERGGSKI